MNDHAQPSLITRIVAAIRDRWEGFWRRRPLRKKATWAFLIGLVGTLGIQLGIQELVEISEQLQDFLTGFWGLLVTVGLVDQSEKAVTPVSDPRSNQGAPLIEYEADPIP